MTSGLNISAAQVKDHRYSGPVRHQRAVAALALGLGSLPLVFALVPDVADARLGPVPLPWLLLGVVVYPALLALGRVYVRRSERAEADFTDLVDPGSVEDVPR